jgi:Flp pilus assembly CpaF family ATPase
VVDAPDRIYVRDPNFIELVQSSVKFESVEALRQVIDALMALGGITLTSANSSGEVRLPDGSRVVAVIPPTSVGSPYLVIQKIRSYRFHLGEPVAWTTPSEETHTLLMNALHLWTNILIVEIVNPKNYLLNLLAIVLILRNVLSWWRILPIASGEATVHSP